MLNISKMLINRIEYGGSFMSNKVMEFYSKAVKDEQFVKSLEKFKTENGTEKTEAIKKVILPYAKKLGYIFTEDELLNSLSAEDLKKVSGGSKATAATFAAFLATLGGMASGQLAHAMPPTSPKTYTTTLRHANPLQEHFSAGSFEFQFNGKGYTLTAVKDKNMSGVFSIPSHVNGGTPVTEIGENAFAECKELTGIMLPSTVTTIGPSAFRDCTKLSIVLLQSSGSVKTIAEDAFFGCSSLTSSTIVNSAREIGPAAFSHSNLRNDRLCIKARTIDIGAFAGSNVTAVEFEDGVESIGNSAFLNCRELTEITISGTVNEICNGAFSLCTQLRSINIKNGVQRIENYAFSGCESLEEITFPKSVTNIGSEIFKNCPRLRTVNIPANLKTEFESNNALPASCIVNYY